MPTVDSALWLTACRAAAEAIADALEARPTIAERAVETGTRGSGGDRTLELDAEAEAIVFAQLDRLHERGVSFRAVSEERGEVSFGDDPQLTVVIDPIDGSLNAKRGLSHHALSIAVSAGPTMADVVFGYVYDFGPREEWRAVAGDGARLNDALLDRSLGERRGGDGRLEVLGIESADPRWLARSIEQLEPIAFRLRALGAIAPALCQVAAARFDALVSLRACRAVDAAAAQLIVREAGGLVSFPACETPLGAPLDTVAHSPVLAARAPGTLAALEAVATR